MDHVRSEWHVTGTSVTWDFRGGGRVTCRGKSRGDGWDCYTWKIAWVVDSIGDFVVDISIVVD